MDYIWQQKIDFGVTWIHVLPVRQQTILTLLYLNQDSSGSEKNPVIPFFHWITQQTVFFPQEMVFFPQMGHTSFILGSWFLGYIFNTGR